ncbi:MAG TPA: response regulator [Steroidobacteraceae bacterium]|nr:response regulator [Steroidobacteraceae bacterium]
MDADAQITSTSVHIIDDDDSFRRSMLRMLLAAGYVATGHRSAAEFLLAYTPGGTTCILLDISMPGPSGIDLLKALMQHDWAPPVIFVTGRDDVITTIDVMKWGAFSYLLKPLGSESLLPVIRAALLADGQRQAARHHVTRLRAQFATLTPSERAIFHGVVNNRLNKQIAAELGVCERTIKAQRASMFEKLQIQSVPELVRAANALQKCEGAGARDPAAWPWFGSRPP